MEMLERSEYEELEKKQKEINKLFPAFTEQLPIITVTITFDLRLRGMNKKLTDEYAVLNKIVYTTIPIIEKEVEEFGPVAAVKHIRSFIETINKTIIKTKEKYGWDTNVREIKCEEMLWPNRVKEIPVKRLIPI